MGDTPISSQINYTSSSDFIKFFAALSKRASEQALCCAMPLGQGIPKINGPSSISGLWGPLFWECPSPGALPNTSKKKKKKKPYTFFKLQN
jgi:hypothetical protein